MKARFPVPLSRLYVSECALATNTIPNHNEMDGGATRRKEVIVAVLKAVAMTK